MANSSTPPSRAVPDAALPVGKARAQWPGALMQHWPLAIAALLGLAYALLMPLFTGPDERGHLGYVVALSQGHLPLMPPNQSVDFQTGTSYQAQHPPLFYLLATPFYRLVQGDFNRGLIVLRLLSVLWLLLIVWLSGRIGAVLLSPRGARRAQIFTAINPVLVYVCAMANNEGMAIALALACVWMALRFRESRAFRCLAGCAICGGLGLLSKLTALGGVLAATLIVTQNCALLTPPQATLGQEPARAGLAGEADEADEVGQADEVDALNPRRRWWAGAVVVLGALLFWVPWMAIMLRTHGTLAPQLFRPMFVGGFGAVLLYPLDALKAAVSTLGEYSLGVGLPMWLMHYTALEDYLIGLGCLLSLWIAAIAWRHAGWRFVAVSYFAVYAMILMQAYFRDLDAVLSASRYVPASAPLVGMLALSRLDARSPTAQRAACVLWLLGALVVHFYIFKFFLL